MLMPWSRSALFALRAAKNRMDPAEGLIWTIDALLAWADDLDPAESALHAALRDETLWPNAPQIRAARRQRLTNANWSLGAGRDPRRWEEQAEAAARAEGVLRVGERHVFAAIQDNELPGVQIAKLRKAVRELELGVVGMTERERQRTHLMPDTSALMEYQRPDKIIWAEALEVTNTVVQLWIVATVLNELDELKRHSTRRVAERAGERGRWLSTLLPEALASEGISLRSDSYVRMWSSGTSSQFRDTDHLEAAVELRSLGVPVEILTDDIHMLTRASVARVPGRRFVGDKYRLEKPREA